MIKYGLLFLLFCSFFSTQAFADTEEEYEKVIEGYKDIYPEMDEPFNCALNAEGLLAEKEKKDRVRSQLCRLAWKPQDHNDVIAVLYGPDFQPVKVIRSNWKEKEQKVVWVDGLAI